MLLTLTVIFISSAWGVWKHQRCLKLVSKSIKLISNRMETLIMHDMFNLQLQVETNTPQPGKPI